MKTILIAAITFASGIGITLSHTHTEAKVKQYIHAAYDIGRSECPTDMHCIGDDIGLVLLTVEDIEGVL